MWLNPERADLLKALLEPVAKGGPGNLYAERQRLGEG
jgi:hypothetical protein